MAKQQSKKDSDKTKKQGNIRLNPSVARTGLNLDSSINQVGPGRLTYALNAAVENFDSSSVNYQNEPGNELCLDFPSGYKLIGSHFIPEKRKNIFFLANPSTGGSEIGFMDNNDCQYQTLVNAPCLNFDVNHPIPKIVHRITNCSTELYWTDGVNPRRYLDIENIPYVISLTAEGSICNSTETDQLDCNQLKLQPNFEIPQLMITQIRNIGNLKAGTYQFAIQYSDASGNELTSFYSVTNPLPIADEFTTTVNFDYPVGKSIVVGVSNLDLSGQFEYYNLAVIKTINNITSVEIVGTYSIEDSTREVTYTGGDQSPIQLSISDIFEKFPYYDIAQDVTAVQDVLVWDNLTSIDRINYQSIANQITLGWETYRIPADENYADELNAVNLRGYMRDEVYAFEIVFLLKNGKQTDGFHIPGRERGSNESYPDVADSGPNQNNDFIGDPDYYAGDVGYKSWWKVYNTASVTGASTGQSSDPNYKGPWEYGEFAYWESTETYPCEPDVWGDLSEQPIRHHKFPDVAVSPIIENGPIVYDNDKIVPTMQDDAVFPIGVKIDNTQVFQLIQNSGLTQDQKDDIVAYKIVRGDRGTNKSVIAKGILRNVNKYTRDEEDYYYPNYPYNDLSSDPYILANNNAWSADSEAYLVYLPEAEPDTSSILAIIQGLEVTVNENQGVFEYTSALNGKVTQAVIDLDEVVEICSLTRPVPLLGRMVIGPGNYDVWRVFTDNTLTSCGHRIRWFDPFTDWNDTPYVDGVFRTQYMFDDGLLGNSKKYTVITEVGAPEPDVVYCGRVWTPVGWVDCCRPRQTRMEEQVFGPGEVENPPGVAKGADYEGSSTSNNGWFGRRTKSRRSSLGCKDEKPQPSIEEQEGGDITYRQVFNSPETSFGQPFLGSVLKLESVMFGGGKAHWVSVKDNANYKLLSKEAQQDALDSSKKMADLSDPQSLGVMFTAYQAYLTIYVNGITRKNYAMSFNSRANYDYSFDIANNVNGGIKQRDIDLTRYLIPGVQSLGPKEEYSINNWNRETSVFIKTLEERELPSSTIVSVPPLPFPSQTPSLLSVGDPLIEDKSRFTIGNKGACATPEKQQDLTVVSYYASMKNIFPNQYGQMYSYTTIDTGYQALAKETGTSTIFGGDTFISRFAFKTKLPYFIDNRVGAPDDSDIFYDEIGNIGYPRYWHSARSILEDYDLEENGETTPVRNLISYKAHNFDCPNDPSTIEPGGGAYRTFYDGYMYLFAYGIPNFYCETTYNTDLRQAFNNKEGDFWPHVSSGIPDDWLQETNVPIAQDNTYYYNVTYSKQNKENVFSHLPPDWKDDLCYTVFPFRAIYSDAAITTADSRVNNWLVYRALSFHDFPQNYGNLTSLDGIQNKAILARFENKSLLYNNLLTIDTSNPQAAYIGNPRLFDSSPPIDFAETDLGYVGSQNKFLLKIPQGQITVDAKRGQVFLVSGTKVQDLTAFGSGVNRFMADHLPFEILEHFPNVPTDNHFNSIGLHGVYDSKFERVIITKRDYIPLRDDIQYDEDTGEFYIEGETARLFKQADPTSNLPTNNCSPYISSTFEGTLRIEYIPCGDDYVEVIEFECGGNSCGGVLVPCAEQIIYSNVSLISLGSCGEETTTTTSTSSSTTTTTTTSNETTTTTTTVEVTTTTTTLEEVPSDPPRHIIYLEDEEYFCNKSWTISFDFNTKSWISFHSYIPNFYIGENNFFYSGVNGCCTSDGSANLEVLAGELLPPTLPTTTTTTTKTTLFPTTTTTSTFRDLVIEGGEVTPTYCELTGGTGIITITTTTTAPCYTPSENSITDSFLEGYQIVGGSPTISTGSSQDACRAMNLISPNVLGIYIQVSYDSYDIGEAVYIWDPIVPYCEGLSEGWYSNTENTDSVFYVASNSRIEQIEYCDSCLSTTTTIAPPPELDECCGFVSVTPEGLYISGGSEDSATQDGYVNVSGFAYSTTTGVAFTSSKLWTIDTDIKEWDITLSPFEATFNRDITYGETPSVAGNIAISNTLLLGVDASTSPQEIVEIDVTTNTAVKTSQFAIQANRVVESNLLYTRENKLVLISKDGLDYYITQFDYSSGNVELDVSLGQLTGRIMLFECDCIIKVILDNVLYIFDSTQGLVNVSETDPSLIPPGESAKDFKTLSQSAAYLNCGIENTTTTSTSTSTTTSTTTLSPTCYEYEVSGPIATYYTDCFGQQQVISLGSGQTQIVCAGLGIIGATLIGPCPDYTTTTSTTNPPF